MGKLIEIIRRMFPLLQPEWIMYRSKDVPENIMAIFNEEVEYHKKIGKSRIDIHIKGYRYILTPKKEVFLVRRKVSLL